MTLFSTVSIVPAEKRTEEHSIPLSPTGEEPPTHYGYHGWEPDRAKGKDELAVSKRADIWTKEHVEKQPILEAEKTGLDNFSQAILAAGLKRIPGQSSSSIKDQADPKGQAPADASPADALKP